MEKTAEQITFDNMQILLAEDNQVNQMVATSLLEKYGCKVTPAGNGNEALKLVKQRKFDLIFMDCQMPEMDGYEATKAIRNLESQNNLERTAIIAFTANAMKGDKEKCLKCGMDDYIAKPVRKSELESILTKWLREDLDETRQNNTIENQNQESESTTLDEEIFEAFSDLMGENLSLILSKHVESANEYIKTMISSAKTNDMAKISDSAHPLKSSSQQIGLQQISNIAEEIENLASSEKPNIETIKNLIKKAMKEQTKANNVLHKYIKEC